MNDFAYMRAREEEMRDTNGEWDLEKMDATLETLSYSFSFKKRLVF